MRSPLTVRTVSGLDWLSPGAEVTDAGYNPGDVGDFDTARTRTRTRLITPVPGGVGPMTIAILLSRIVDAAVRQLGLPGRCHQPRWPTRRITFAGASTPGKRSSPRRKRLPRGLAVAGQPHASTPQ
ncbi:hypothetical protein ITI46_16565 [Streptomyces oryzae]|uniref:Tetrahydrofolate dehydrogenase/cyclohydrolase NAD(P)-binding domain-containing protein n=1 Tax=Streptomyces oryzae TaxID=1434886 RepID=A0ABS3XD18_9ACTN|nr:hypothetical protein [Streptomyces oryzae]